MWRVPLRLIREFAARESEAHARLGLEALETLPILGSCEARVGCPGEALRSFASRGQVSRQSGALGVHTGERHGRNREG